MIIERLLGYSNKGIITICYKFLYKNESYFLCHRKNSNKYPERLNFQAFTSVLIGCKRLFNFSKIKEYNYFLHAGLWRKQGISYITYFGLQYLFLINLRILIFFFFFFSNSKFGWHFVPTDISFDAIHSINTSNGSRTPSAMVAHFFGVWHQHCSKAAKSSSKLVFQLDPL